MRTRLGFLTVLLVGLGALSWLADGFLSSSLRTWFLRDASSRARVAVSSGRIALESRMRYGDSDDIEILLRDLTRDERIMSIGLCDDEMRTRQVSDLFPVDYDCPGLVRRWRENLPRDSVWELVSNLPSGPVMISVHRLGSVRDTTGWVAVVQDLSALDRRSARTRGMLFLFFAGLAVAASLLTIVWTRVARNVWTEGMRKALRGEEGNQEFRPLLKDMRELVEELAADRVQDGRAGGWTAERLKSTLHQHLHGEKILVLANREPYIHQRDDSGAVAVKHPASGLVTALEPLLRACSGTWVAHGSGNADREVVDARGRIAVPPGNPSYQLRRVWLGTEEEDGFYYGFSNEGLWPLCHIAHTRPHFRREDWKQYQAVNRKFAEAVCAEAEVDDPVVLVQDYHFALAPRMIRERLPKATIITFWHIPWPNAERFGICPWGEELLDGLLGSSIVGFHTQLHCNNFLEAVDARLEARIDHEDDAVIRGGLSSLVRPYPISIAWPDPWIEGLPSVERCREEVAARLGIGSEVRLGIGVDRLDYTKGLEERFRAVDEMMRAYPEFRGTFTFVQIGAPSRSRIPEYRRMTDNLVETAEEINRRWETPGWKPIVLIQEHHESAEVYRFYRAADLCYVSSLHDGMNLVAKEYIAARDDERGVLVLSEFAGAAKELTEALVVNPYDLTAAASALAAAVRMPPAEQRERMRSMRLLVAQRNVFRWAGRMLLDAAALRRRQRMTGKLTTVEDLAGRMVP